MRRYQILRRKDSGRVREIGPKTALLRVPMDELARAAREGMRDLSDRLGLELMRLAIEDERAAVTEGPERVGWKHGHQPGFVHLNGRNVAFPNRRVRSYDGKEVRLQSYAKFQEDGVNGRLALRDMMRGVSTRDYREGVEGFLRGHGIARSSVSRSFIRASEAKLKELMERDLSKLDLVALFFDGVGFAGHLLIVAMGVDAQGEKHALGLWQGDGERGRLPGLARRPDSTGPGPRGALPVHPGWRQGPARRDPEDFRQEGRGAALPGAQEAQRPGAPAAAPAGGIPPEAGRGLRDAGVWRGQEGPAGGGQGAGGHQPISGGQPHGGPGGDADLASAQGPGGAAGEPADDQPAGVALRLRAAEDVQGQAVARGGSGAAVGRCGAAAAEGAWKKVRGHTLMPHLLEALCRREIGQEVKT